MGMEIGGVAFTAAFELSLLFICTVHGLRVVSSTFCLVPTFFSVHPRQVVVFFFFLAMGIKFRAF